MKMHKDIEMSEEDFLDELVVQESKHNKVKSGQRDPMQTSLCKKCNGCACEKIEKLENALHDLAQRVD